MAVELLGDLLADKPKESDGNDAVIVVDCIPVVGQDRLEKLKGVLTKIFGRHGHIQNTWYPEEDGKTKGFVLFMKIVASTVSKLTLFVHIFIVFTVTCSWSIRTAVKLWRL